MSCCLGQTIDVLKALTKCFVETNVTKLVSFTYITDFHRNAYFLNTKADKKLLIPI